MSGIYDFEMKRTPYLDVEMLLERKAKKRERMMLVLSCMIAAIMGVVAIAILVAIAMIDKNIFIISAVLFALYVIIGVICVGRFMKKREVELWQQLI